MENHIVSDEQIVASLEAKIAELNNRIQKYIEAISAIRGTSTEASNVPIPNQPHPIAKLTGTFKQTMVQILTERNRPMLAKEIIATYNSMSGKQTSYNTFSGQFSQIVTKGDVIKKHTIHANPLESKYYYGLTDWFNGENLKQEYLQKIHA